MRGDGRGAVSPYVGTVPTPPGVHLARRHASWVALGAWAAPRESGVRPPRGARPRRSVRSPPALAPASPAREPAPSKGHIAIRSAVSSKARSSARGGFVGGATRRPCWTRGSRRRPPNTRGNVAWPCTWILAVTPAAVNWTNVGGTKVVAPETGSRGEGCAGRLSILDRALESMGGGLLRRPPSPRVPGW